MGKPKSPAKKTAPINPDVVVGEHQPVSNRLVLWAVAGIALLLLGMGFVWMGLSDKGSVGTSRLPDGIDTQYETTEPKNLPLLLEHDYGLSVADAEKGRFGKSVRTSEEARKVAIALYRMEKHGPAIKAYELARSKSEDKDEKYRFTIKLMQVSGAAGNQEQEVRYFKEATSMIDTLSTSPQERSEMQETLEASRVRELP